MNKTEKIKNSRDDKGMYGAEYADEGKKGGYAEHGKNGQDRIPLFEIGEFTKQGNEYDSEHGIVQIGYNFICFILENYCLL